MPAGTIPQYAGQRSEVVVEIGAVRHEDILNAVASRAKQVLDVCVERLVAGTELTGQRRRPGVVVEGEFCTRGAVGKRVIGPRRQIGDRGCNGDSETRAEDVRSSTRVRVDGAAVEVAGERVFVVIDDVGFDATETVRMSACARETLARVWDSSRFGRAIAARMAMIPPRPTVR